MTNLVPRVAGAALVAVNPLSYFTAGEMSAWRQYREAHYFAGYAHLAIYLTLMVWLVFFSGSARIKSACDRAAGRWLPPGRTNAFLRVIDRVWKDRTWAGAMLFVAAFTGLFALSSLPVAAYFQLDYDKRYGLSTYTVPHWIRDAVVGTLTETVLVSLLAFTIYALVRRLTRWWLPLGLAAAGLSFFSGVIDPYRQVLEFDDKPMAEGPARTAIDDVLARAQVETAGIYVRNASRVTRALDAFFVGQGPSRRIVLYDNLVAALTPAELAVAVAHEAGHLKESRFWPALGTAVVMFALIFLLDRILRAMARRPRFGLTSHADPAGLPVVFLMVTILMWGASPLSAAYARSLERDADAFALEVTHDPTAFLSLMVKLARLDKADVDPPAWVQWKFSHPTVLERLAFGELAKASTDSVARPLSPPGR